MESPSHCRPLYRQEEAMFAWFAMPALVTATFALAVYQRFGF
jgi:hypothetical protein